ncbi:MAG: hypothetical protein IT537_11180 [Hyphomicrobiales bacterium]|nr:hypothetical protein [Hyphomicrobiales bacterium]
MSGRAQRDPGPRSTGHATLCARLVEVKGALSSSSSAALAALALEGHGIIRVPHYSVAARLADKSLQPILQSVTLSPERMRAYYSKAKHLPAKTTGFIRFLKASVALL